MAGRDKRFLFAGGGTGGHVLPNLAIQAELQRRTPGASFLYVGARRGYERRVAESGIPFRSVCCARFVSPRRPLRFLAMFVRIALGVLQSAWIIARFKPDVVVATGGFVSVPPVLAARILARRIYLHEQNVRPGLANRFLANLANRVGVSFKEALGAFPRGKTHHVGYPLREQITNGSPQRARDEYAIGPGNRVALIVGGSMGARSINRGTVEALPPLLEEQGITIVHVTGLARGGEYDAYEDTRRRLRRQGLPESIPGRYICRPYIQRIQDVYAMADLIVARAGAGTVMELAAVGKPSILIPKSDAPDNHQMLNALSLERRGASQVLLEELADENGRTLTRVPGEALALKIKELLAGDERKLADMGEQARRLSVEDALSANVTMIQRLAEGDPDLERIAEEDRVGFLVAANGSSHELLFRSNVLGSGFFSDIGVPAAGGGLRAVIQRARSEGATEFVLLPRRGPVQVNGEPVERRRRLAPEDRLTLGAARFTFTTEPRTRYREARGAGIGLKVLLTSLGTLTSRAFGFVREAATAATLGLSSSMDLLAVGLTVSNFFRGVFAEIAVDTAFLPTYVHLLRTGRQGAANRLFSSILSLMLVASAAATGVAILTLPLWMPWIAPGFEARGIMDQAVSLTRIMFPYLILVSVAALLSAVLRAHDRFAVPAFSSIMFNLGVLGGLAFFPAFGLSALGYGVLVGGMGQILFQLPALMSRRISGPGGLRFQPGVDMKDPGVRKVGRVAPNIVADVSIQKLGSVVDKVLATPMLAGMVGALHVALVIFRLPYGLISQSINTVILKEVSDGQAVRDGNWTRRLLAGSLNWSLFTLLPLTACMVILAEPLVSLLFEYASFTADQTRVVAGALRFYALGLVGWGVTGLCGRFFAARMEQSLATATSFFALLLNVAVSVTLVQAGMGIAGLCLGTSIAFLACAVLRLWILQRSLTLEGTPLRRSDLWPSLVQTVACTLGAGVAMAVVYAAVRDFAGLPLLLNRLFVLGVPLGFGVFAYVAVAMMVRSEQLEDVLIKLGRMRDRGDRKTEPTAPVNPYCLKPDRLLDWVTRRPGAHLQFNFARRVGQFLKNRDWKVRNVGVKLAGRLRIRSFRYELCTIAACREPAPLTHRLLGGDFREPGFVRRNAVNALAMLEICDERVSDALHKALQDPYWEVRAAALRVLAGFADRLPDRETSTRAACRATRERNFEVAQQAVLALGRLAETDAVVPTLQALHYHRNWQVRNAVILTYRHLHERRVLPDRSRVLALLDDVLATSEGFRPTFPLKQDLTALQAELIQPDPEQEDGT